MMRTTVNTQPQIIIVVCCITLRRSAYGAWGNYSVHDNKGAKNTSATFIGHINTLRYRGYYYDRETRLYYLQSRYYDFANCRFINADGVVTTNVAEFLECNMFAYCTNNPINFSDEDGKCYYANGVWTHDAWENIGGYEKNRSQKVSLEHMALFRLPGESQDRYLLRELQIAAGMKHLQLLLDSVVVWGVVSLLMRHKRNSKQVIPDHHLGLCIIRMRLLFGICKDGV